MPIEFLALYEKGATLGIRTGFALRELMFFLGLELSYYLAIFLLDCGCPEDREPV